MGVGQNWMISSTEFDKKLQQTNEMIAMPVMGEGKLMRLDTW